MLIFRIDLEYIETNTLGFARFVEQTVTLRLFQRGGDCIFVQSFQFAHVDSVETLINVFTISFLLQQSPKPAQWIVKVVHHAFFQWNNAIIRDLDALGANFRAAFGDVAVTDSLRVS